MESEIKGKLTSMKCRDETVLGRAFYSPDDFLLCELLVNLRFNLVSVRFCIAVVIFASWELN